MLCSLGQVLENGFYSRLGPFYFRLKGIHVSMGRAVSKLLSFSSEGYLCLIGLKVPGYSFRIFELFSSMVGG